MTSLLSWSDKINIAFRDVFLLLINEEDGDKIEVFRGATIPGLVTVIGKKTVEACNFNYTNYHLQLSDKVRYIAGMNGFETGSFLEGLAQATGCSSVPITWEETARALGISVTSTMNFLRDWRPKTAGMLDRAGMDEEGYYYSSGSEHDQVDNVMTSALKSAGLIDK